MVTTPLYMMSVSCAMGAADDPVGSEICLNLRYIQLGLSGR